MFTLNPLSALQPARRFVRLLAACLLLATSLVPGLSAQDTTEPTSNAAELIRTVPRGVIPADINGHRTIIEPRTYQRPLRVAIYEGLGSPEGGILNVSGRLKQIPGTTVDRLSAEQIGTKDLTRYDVVVFSGGLSTRQASNIGESGKENIRRYVAGGGNYLGVCAGAFLALVGEEWSIGLVNARLVPGNRWRGNGFMDLELSPEGREFIGNTEGTFKCRYNNGPIIEPLKRPDLPPFTTLAWFRSEVSRNGSRPGLMTNSPAIIKAPYGQGRVLLISPHPENTPGLEHLITNAVYNLVKR